MGSVGGGGTGGVGEQPQPGRLLSIPKEGERILAPTRRPDGTLRKPIRIRAGYVPQDEVAIYQSKGALLRKEAEQEYPPGYNPESDAKAKTKSAKRNERKKEKKQQAALASLAEKGKTMDVELPENYTENAPVAELTVDKSEPIDSVTSRINSLSVSPAAAVPDPSTDSIETSKSGTSDPDLDKRIRALKKKIRLAEAQLKGDQQHLKPEQLEKLSKLEGWHDELKLLEDKKENLVF